MPPCYRAFAGSGDVVQSDSDSGTTAVAACVYALVMYASLCIYFPEDDDASTLHAPPRLTIPSLSPRATPNSSSNATRTHALCVGQCGREIIRVSVFIGDESGHIKVLHVLVVWRVVVNHTHYMCDCLRAVD